MAHWVRLADLGIDNRVLAGLVGLTVLAVGLGFGLASTLDGTRTTVGVAAPAPSLSPEAIDPAPPPTAPNLPDVIVPGPTTQTTPPPAAPPSVTQPPPAQTQTTPSPSTSTRTTPPPQTKTTPRPTTSTGTTTVPTVPPAGPPRTDPGDPVQFRPDGANQPLPQFLIPDGELPADSVAATAALTAAQKNATGTTRADLTYVQSLGTKFSGARFAGRKATVDRILRVNAWWYARRKAPSGRVLVRDPQGLIYSYAPAHGFAFNPVGTAGRWQRLNDAFTSVQLATTLLELGVADDRGGRQTLNWEYYDVPGQPTAAQPGVSAMAQARIAQLLANAYRASGDARFATASAEAMASMAVDVAVGGSRSLVAYPKGSTVAPWFVERAYPGEDPWKGAALNGFMVSLIELRSAERALRDPVAGPAAVGDAAANEAKRLADEGAASLDRYLPAHDTGKWSYYGMLTPGRSFRTHVANATYHCYHVSLLRSLAPMYPALRFSTFADTWAAYAVAAGAKCPTNDAPAG